jgi:acyl-CoA synthetase (AMP-forming)/AMP-acid ligase II
MNISSELFANAQQFPFKTAFIENNKKYTYKQTAQMTKHAAEVLRAHGIKEKSNIILLEPVSVKMYCTLMAVWSIGAAVTIFDPSATPEYIEKCLTRVSPEFFIGCRKAFLLKLKLRALNKIKNNMLTDELFSDEAFKNEDLSFSGSADCSSFPALITFTSGTTGIPKVTVRTQDFLLTQLDVISQTMPYSGSDIDIAVLPVFTVANIAEGITTVIPGKALGALSGGDPSDMIKLIRKNNVTRITASPAIIGAIADALAKRGKTISSMTSLNAGGGPIFPYLIKNVGKAFPDSALKLVYGSTEAEPIAEVAYEDLTDEQKQRISDGGGLIGGYVVSGIECRVIEPRNGPLGKMTAGYFDKITLTHNVGEIVVSGKHVQHGYLDGIGNEENKFDVENTRWHRTGDLGYFADDGMLMLMGRVSAAVRDERGILYPFATETAVCEKYGIRHCAVSSYDSKRILTAECGAKTFEKIDSEKTALGIDKVLRINKMPLDIRHHTKIDYAALNTFIKSQLSDNSKTIVQH